MSARRGLVVTSGDFDDGFPGYVAMNEDLPEFLGHGEDDDEAVEDWIEQYSSRVLH